MRTLAVPTYQQFPHPHLFQTGVSWVTCAIFCSGSVVCDRTTLMPLPVLCQLAYWSTGIQDPSELLISKMCVSACNLHHSWVGCNWLILAFQSGKSSQHISVMLIISNLFSSMRIANFSSLLPSLILTFKWLKHLISLCSLSPWLNLFETLRLCLYLPCCAISSAKTQQSSLPSPQGACTLTHFWQVLAAPLSRRATRAWSAFWESSCCWRIGSSQQKSQQCWHSAEMKYCC